MNGCMKERDGWIVELCEAWVDRRVAMRKEFSLLTNFVPYARLCRTYVCALQVSRIFAGSYDQAFRQFTTWRSRWNRLY